MSLVIAADRSGVGKTTVTAAILASLKARPGVVQSFKVGPDYIDPMFHTVVTQRPCRNLDPILTSEPYTQQIFHTHTQQANYALIEGVMGLFDGAIGQQGRGSTAHIARLLDVPIALVLDCSRLSDSIAALVHGYRSFDPQLQIAGVILNRVGSDRHLQSLKSALQPLSIRILGVLQRQPSIHIPDRHLGLVPIDELEGADGLLQQLATVGNRCFDWSALLPLLATTQATPTPLAAPVRPQISALTSSTPSSRVRIAIAKDVAFSFYYADNLDQLRHLGAELVFWSPIHDNALPNHIHGLYLGGGFPEMFAVELSENVAVLQDLKTAIQAGLPTYAECGGLMYLCESLQGLQGKRFPMVGVLPANVKMAKRLTLGYRCAISTQNTPLLTAGTTVWGHEFHHSELDQDGDNPTYTFSRQTVAHPSEISEGWHRYNLHASYLHLHWGNQPEIPKRFIQQCRDFKATC
ncbi:cobyrinate a,c-diamide synthase [Acaryochloris marina]|uniref:Cobyrinate a,c-diamide synthase n=1 Tax=Acaryochloris marina (strain MBIC 11017) TaxID=329726 RepID=B0CAE5_ACAM1|nr:cobyrinate a,c-diamide synthase [Acaryochloris marina]ABW27880.1 cobyrinic Acid a,c-diamide synthase [Acaryochloris marina MBIC11017]